MNLKRKFLLLFLLCVGVLAFATAASAALPISSVVVNGVDYGVGFPQEPIEVDRGGSIPIRVTLPNTTVIRFDNYYFGWSIVNSEKKEMDLYDNPPLEPGIRYTQGARNMRDDEIKIYVPNNDLGAGFVYTSDYKIYFDVFVGSNAPFGEYECTLFYYRGLPSVAWQNREIISHNFRFKVKDPNDYAKPEVKPSTQTVKVTPGGTVKASFTGNSAVKSCRSYA